MGDRRPVKKLFSAADRTTRHCYGAYDTAMRRAPSRAPTRSPVTLMALSSRICLFALILAMVAAVFVAPTASASRRSSAVVALDDPARLTGSVPLSIDGRPKNEQASLGQRAVRIAAGELGVPYRYGGSTPSGFDCSGLVAYVYGRLGVSLPHNAAAQYAFGRAVDRSHLRPGDLVFFHGLGHVGLYVGNDRFIHAAHSGTRVRVDSMSGWYEGRYDGARRLVVAVARKAPKPPSLAPLARWLLAKPA